MMKRARDRLYAILLFVGPLLLCSGCGTSPRKQPLAAEKSSVELQPVPVPDTGAVTEAQKPKPAPSSVEVIWQAPTGPVESYHIYVSKSDGSEDRHIRIPVQKLKKIDHPTHGPVYRYELQNVDRSADVRITLRAENQHGLSEPSVPIAVPLQ